MPTNEDFKSYRETLSDSEKRKIDSLAKTEQIIQKEIIEDNIQRDREHLRLVNFCINPFEYKGILHSTGYLFVRVEPLYGREKSFDLVIYNKNSKVMILVECKSSVSDVNHEIAELLKADKIAQERLKDLEEMVGDAVNVKETVFCTNAAYAAKVKDKVMKDDLPICVWSADQGVGRLLLEKQPNEIDLEISNGRLHHDNRLTGMLLNGVNSAALVRRVFFLPSSHPCTILEEVVPLLKSVIDKLQSDRFSIRDLTNVLSKENSLSNFTAEELWSLSESALRHGLPIDVFQDCSPGEQDISKKKFEIVVRKAPAKMTKDIHEKYVNYHSWQHAENVASAKFKEIRWEGYAKLNSFNS